MTKKSKIVLSVLAAVVLVAAIACFVLAGCFRKAPEDPIVSEPEVIVDSSDVVSEPVVEDEPDESEPVVSSEPAASEPVESEAPDAKEETPSKPASDKKGNTSSNPPKTPPKSSENAKPGDRVYNELLGEWFIAEEGPGGGYTVEPGTDGGRYVGA